MKQLRLNLLGGLEILDAVTDEPLAITRRKASALLAVLGMPAGLKRSREEIADLFWGHTGETGARNNLRQTLLVLRRALPDFQGLQATRDTLVLTPDLVSVDVDDFERAAAGASVADLERAASLYAGDFLHGFSLREEPFERWRAGEAARLQDIALLVFERLMTEYLALDRFPDAVRVANRSLAIDPLHEAAHRTLITAYAALGRNNLARRQYQTCRDLLERELGVTPSQLTESALAGLGEQVDTAPMARSKQAPKRAFPWRDWIGGIAVVPRRLLASVAAVSAAGLLAATMLWQPAPTVSLQEAISTGDIEEVRGQLAQGADANQADFLSGLPLMIAARENRVAIAEVLVSHGADVNAWDMSGTALHSAAYAGHAAMVEFLIAKGAAVNISPDGTTTPLHQAATNGHVYTAELLIRHGARVNRAYHQSSPLHLAAAAGHREMVELLIAHGADVMHREAKRNAPIHRAVIGGHTEIVELLLNAGTEIVADGHQGHTPLSLARAHDQTQVAALLVKHGAMY